MRAEGKLNKSLFCKGLDKASDEKIRQKNQSEHSFEAWRCRELNRIKISLGDSEQNWEWKIDEPSLFFHKWHNT